MALEYDVHAPETVRDGSPLVVLLHGRGSDRSEILGLRGAVTADSVIVTPQAPFSAVPWGFERGWAWYRYLGEDRPDPEDFDESHRRLAAFLDHLSDALPFRPGPLVLAGFSQGGTMSLSHALRNPGRVPYVLVFSGFLASHPSVRATRETVRGTRIFWGHGVRDPAIPTAMAERGRTALRSAGADLEARDYDVSHSVHPDELRDAREWLTSCLISRAADATVPGRSE